MGNNDSINTVIIHNDDLKIICNDDVITFVIMSNNHVITEVIISNKPLLL